LRMNACWCLENLLMRRRSNHGSRDIQEIELSATVTATRREQAFMNMCDESA
jgi:hypothetical protein